MIQGFLFSPADLHSMELLFFIKQHDVCSFGFILIKQKCFSCVNILGIKQLDE